ncbi:MAG: hypothetical protein HYR51_00055 [Candidatus Rokubacteria bacterium]|nr:hypothetical protein [Candidatus Rokubacteria bacterium]
MLTDFAGASTTTAIDVEERRYTSDHMPNDTESSVRIPAHALASSGGHVPVTAPSDAVVLCSAIAILPGHARPRRKQAMTTLHTPALSEFSAEDRATLERVAKRMGQTPEDLLRPGIFGVQAHWPAWLEANLDQTVHGYRMHGVLPALAKEAMHVAVSMTNHCNF